jgi:thiamine biosynthesis lipoprotein
VAGEEVHHLVDPRSGRPGGDGLASVTVVEADPARAEVWSKALFLSGTHGVGDLAEAVGAAALWVARDGVIGSTPAMDAVCVWRRDHG